ncbi:hypothetical protein [Microbacterium aurum]
MKSSFRKAPTTVMSRAWCELATSGVPSASQLPAGRVDIWKMRDDLFGVIAEDEWAGR